MSELLEQVYASAPVDKTIHHTLVIRAGNVVRRLVDGYSNLSARLENGTLVTYEKSFFALSLPPKSTKGQQELQFQIDNVSGDSLQFVSDALERGDVVMVEYRAYLSSNLSSPDHKAIVMTAVAAAIDEKSAALRATFHDLVNASWPRRRYTAQFAPGLTYL